MIATVDIVFKILNFLVVFFVVWYVIKRYAIDMIRSYMQTDRALFGTMQQKYSRLHVKTEKLQYSYEQQEAWFTVMQERFILWQENALHNIKKKQDEKKKIIAAIEQADAVKLENMQHDLLVRKQLKPILRAAKAELKKKYHHSSSRKEYMRKLFEVIEVKS